MGRWMCPHSALKGLAQLINLLSWLPGHSGFGSYVQRVVPGLEGWRLQLDGSGQGCLIDRDAWQPEPPPQAPGRLMRLLQRYGMTQHGLDLPALLQGSGFHGELPELIYSPFFDALLCWPQLPQLITCHDLTPLTCPNSRKAWLKYRFWQPRHLRCATRVIAISRHVADQLISFGLPAERIRVVANGIRVQRPVLPAPQSADLVVLARHDANKNLPALLRALAGVQRQLPHWRGRVRIIGRDGPDSQGLRRGLRALPQPERVELIPSLPPEALIQTLRGSLALISASKEEGFDYPVLEAKAEGLPTLISDIPVHREFHQGSSLFFPVNDDGTVLAGAINQLLRDPTSWRDLSGAGRDLAHSLSVEQQVGAIQQLISDLRA